MCYDTRFPLRKKKQNHRTNFAHGTLREIRETHAPAFASLFLKQLLVETKIITLAFLFSFAGKTDAHSFFVCTPLNKRVLSFCRVQ